MQFTKSYNSLKLKNISIQLKRKTVHHCSKIIEIMYGISCINHLKNLFSYEPKSSDFICIKKINPLTSYYI